MRWNGREGKGQGKRRFEEIMRKGKGREEKRRGDKGGEKKRSEETRRAEKRKEGRRREGKRREGRRVEKKGEASVRHYRITLFSSHSSSKYFTF